MKGDQLSKTAAFVAIKFYGLTRDERFRSIFDPAVVTFYDQLVQSLPRPLSYYHKWLQYPWVRKFYIWGEELLLPGDLMHIIARKWYIHQITQQLVDDGYEQIIILGAGFDHLGYHFEQKGVSCIEIDAPQMATLKQQFLNEHYFRQSHPHIISHHSTIRQPLPKFSDHSIIDSDRKTVVVSEGFFDYLTTDVVNKLLEQICNNFSHKSVLVSTHFSLDELSFIHRKVFQKSIRAVGEQLRFHSSINAFKQMLSAHGYKICQFFDTQTISRNLRDQINTELPVLKGFYILSAEA